MRPGRLALLAAALAAALAACRKLDTKDLDRVRALAARARPRFQPPADGLLTEAQVDMVVRVRRAAGRRPPSDVASEMGLDPAELAWARARITEALLALDAKQVADSAYETYGAAIARLRETRRATRDARAAVRLDAEIAALERERGGLKRGEAATAVSRNGARVAPRRAELERAGP
jgi:hypothetical protein